jgi:hypothetical protein
MSLLHTPCRQQQQQPEKGAFLRRPSYAWFNYVVDDKPLVTFRISLSRPPGALTADLKLDSFLVVAMYDKQTILIYQQQCAGRSTGGMQVYCHHKKSEAFFSRVSKGLCSTRWSVIIH